MSRNYYCRKSIQDNEILYGIRIQSEGASKELSTLITHFDFFLAMAIADLMTEQAYLFIPLNINLLNLKASIIEDYQERFDSWQSSLTIYPEKER